MSEQPSLQAVAVPPAVEDPPKEEKKNKDKKKEELRGVETMYRVTYQNHIALSQLADNKANILISINGVIISVMIAIVTRLGAVSWSLLPAVLLITGALVSLGFAVDGGCLASPGTRALGRPDWVSLGSSAPRRRSKSHRSSPATIRPMTIGKKLSMFMEGAAG